jgi:hypothetical protein
LPPASCASQVRLGQSFSFHLALTACVLCPGEKLMVPVLVIITQNLSVFRG